MFSLPYWRLSGFYFFYFAFVGAFTPFWSLYLQSLEFNAFQIGVLMSLLQVSRIFAPNLWGWLADHTGRRVAVVQLAAFLSLIFYLGVFAGDSFIWMFVVMALMSLFWSASLPLVEAITLGHLGAGGEGYGRIRLWGSVGFIIAVIILGYVLDYAPVRALLWIVLGLKAGIFLLSRKIPEPKIVPHHTDDQPVWNILRRPDVAAFLVACFLMAAAHGVYYTFYSIYLVEHGYSKSVVGWLWALGVICEVLVFLWMPRMAARFGLWRILIASFALAALRFFLIGWGVEYILIIVFAQTLHAASFGSFHAAAVALVHQFFRGKHQAKGQGLYTSISFGLGGTLGGLMSGYTWDALGADWSFSISALFALAGYFVLLWRVRHAPSTADAV
ncbi:MFS transporter [Methylobacillus sp. MM3]|jgi:PPP family 3-phenylpropionic acid transporter|uniref:MFS transporter n=1 Tax=Methylobacillus sp. MM3 TaxID=1848039 RepID=UPI0007E1105A|nr:MFS transporter [Methylobacillus sp. MM3]OAJ71360.1 MFS transporter [Methylobacillus sp. MM3]